MHALNHFAGLALQGSCWIALFLCGLRLFGKLPHPDFVRFLSILLPFWCVASGAVFHVYGREVLIAFYGANPHEGFAFVKNGQEVSQESYFVIFSFTAFACLLPFPLLLRRLRTNFPTTFTISLIIWICLVPLTAFG